MKSSVKGLIGLSLLSILSTGIYYFWKEGQLKKIETQRSLSIKPWNKLDWNKLVVLGLWSDRPLKLIESSGTYFLTVSHKKIPLYLKVQDQSHRYSAKEIVKYLCNPTDSLEKSYFSNGFSYLGDKTMVKRIHPVKNRSYLLELGGPLQQNLWWFHEKDPKGKVIFFFNKEIIGVFHPKGSLIGDQMKLENVRQSRNFEKWVQMIYSCQ